MEPVKTPEPRQREEEEDHEQEHDHMKGQKDPRCLKWGVWRAPVEARIRRVYRPVKRWGEMSELSTTVNRCTPQILPWLHIDLQRLKIRSIALTIAFSEQMYQVAITGHYPK
jgi:hypothetical protein